MLNFQIDMDKCTQCGECARDCPMGIIEMENGPIIPADKEERCIQCQHCLAVCKPGALSIWGKDPANSLPIKNGLPDPVRMETLIMGRRSTRKYKKEGVDPALIRHLLEVTSHAPTAVNQRQTLLTVVDDPRVMDQLREEVTAASLKAFREGRIPEGLERMADYLRRCESGEDVIFRNAPHLLVASAPEAAFAPSADCHIAMSYFELLANSHGLGTVWNGIAKVVFTMIAPEFLKRLGIPDNHLVVCAMCFGKPDVKYHRTVQRPGGAIHRVAL